MAGLLQLIGLFVSTVFALLLVLTHKPTFKPAWKEKFDKKLTDKKISHMRFLFGCLAACIVLTLLSFMGSGSCMTYGQLAGVQSKNSKCDNPPNDDSGTGCSGCGGPAPHNVNDGTCDDGGDGAGFALVDCGTDMTDCGKRVASQCCTLKDASTSFAATVASTSFCAGFNFGAFMNLVLLGIYAFLIYLLRLYSKSTVVADSSSVEPAATGTETEKPTKKPSGTYIA